MKTRYFYVGIVMLLALSACNEAKEAVEVNGTPLVLTAFQESSPASKTAVENGGKQVFWEPGDEIKVFSGSRTGRFTASAEQLEAVTTFTGHLEGTEPDVADIWAVYPYSEDASFDGDCITTVIPSVQVARPGTFAQGANVAIAHSSTTDLHFYNVGGGIRFSLTEEGVSKVIFEGLGGEVISGTVKVGFEEGLPKVQSVSDGSIFLTLTPPDGETFATGQWYYMVAIPGALESGFKLRFYKQDTFAKVISEKAYTIKRRIFGSVTNVSQGMEFEATVTNFPETKEEISESVDLTYEIGDKVSVILGTAIQPNGEDLESVAREMERVTGVQEVEILSSGKTIAVKQKDGIWLNFFLDTNAVSDKANETNNAPTLKASSQRTKIKTVNQLSKVAQEDSGFVLNGKKALVLQPFYSDGGYHEYEMLDDYFEVTHLKDNQSSLAHFKGDYLDNFDVVLIETHGGVTYSMYNPKKEFGIGKDVETTSFSTHVLYSKELAEKIIDANILSREQVAISFVLDENGTFHPIGDETKHYSPYFSMTPSFLEGASFNNTVVYLNTCHSGEQIGDRPFGDMVPAFLNKGAGIVAFNNDTVNQKTSYHCVYNFFEMLAHGISFQDTYKSITSSSEVKVFCDTYWDFIKNDADIEPEEQGHVQIYNRLQFKQNEEIDANHFFLFNSVPQLSYVDHGYLEWECLLDSFSVTWPIYDNPTYDLVADYSVSYDVYVDSCFVATINGRSDKHVDYSTPGDHKWYVIANVFKYSHGIGSPELVASYRSAVGDFTIESSNPPSPVYPTPEPVDLGLSIKWASFNLGASKPEEYGDYFAWGETEPYYEEGYAQSDSPVWKDGKSQGYWWPSYKWCNGTTSSFTKYCSQKTSWGSTEPMDYKTVLDPEDDAARVNLGGKWRTPTYEEWIELRDNSTSIWTTENGIAGRRITSTKPGYTDRFIFLPAGDDRNQTKLGNDNTFGFYWSASLFSSGSPTGARSVNFNSGDIVYGGGKARCYGFSIRPVTD